MPIRAFILGWLKAGGQGNAAVWLPLTGFVGTLFMGFQTSEAENGVLFRGGIWQMGFFPAPLTLDLSQISGRP